MIFSIIAAADKKMGIGKNNQLPWRLKAELKYFTETTSGAAEGKMNAVIMGLNTWLSLPDAHKPLKNRVNVVLSKDPVQLPEGVINAQSFDDAFEKIGTHKNIDQVFVIGGASIYAQAIKLPECRAIYLTEIDGEFDCDTFFPEFDKNIYTLKALSEPVEENGIRYKYAVYAKG